MKTARRKNIRKAPFRWYGAKTKLMPKFIPHIPNHRIYVSVFGGSGADIFHKWRSRVEIYNDLSGNLHTFYSVLRDPKNKRQLIYMLEHTPVSQKQFNECRIVIQCSTADPVERAWAFYYVAEFGFAGKDPAKSTAGNFTISKGSGVPPKWINCRQHLERLARRFRHVVSRNDTWQTILEEFDTLDTFFYLDPPYLPASRRSKGDYELEMSEAQHIELLIALQQINGKAMLSGYPSKLYEDHLKKWRRVEFQTRCWCAPGSKKPARTEVIWMNYDRCGARITTS